MTLESNAVATEKDPTTSSRPTLLRALGKWDLTAIGVNQVIGAGIFVLPASVAALVGQAASPIVWIVAAAANAVIILCFAEAGSRFRDAGGPYLYAKEAFGPFVGFEVAWMMVLTRVASQAALANAFALYAGYFWAGATQGAGRAMVVTVLLMLLALINFRGVRQGSWTVNFFALGKLLPLVAFALLGLWYVDWTRFNGLMQPKLEGFGQATLLLMYAFGGYELITIPAGEAESPRKGVPRALLATIGIVSALYIIVQVIAAGTLSDLAGSESPLADAAAHFIGPATGIAIALGGLISIGGANAGTMLAGPRLFYALAEKKQFPQLFARLHAQFRTPHVSIFIYTLISLFLALTGSFVQLAAVSAVARLTFYTTTCASIPILRRRGPAVTEKRFQVSGGSVIPVLGTIVSLAIIAGSDSRSLTSGLLAFTVGAVFYIPLAKRRRHSR